MAERSHGRGRVEAPRGRRDGTHIFLISAVVAVVGVIAALLLEPITLHTTIDLADKEPAPDPVVR